MLAKCSPTELCTLCPIYFQEKNQLGQILVSVLEEWEWDVVIELF